MTVQVHSVGRTLELGVTRAGGAPSSPGGVPVIALEGADVQVLLTPKQALVLAEEIRKIVHDATARGLAAMVAEAGS